jgi:hypothetical protein
VIKYILIFVLLIVLVVIGGGAKFHSTEDEWILSINKTTIVGSIFNGFSKIFSYAKDSTQEEEEEEK